MHSAFRPCFPSLHIPATCFLFFLTVSRLHAQNNYDPGDAPPVTPAADGEGEEQEQQEQQQLSRRAANKLDEEKLQALLMEEGGGGGGGGGVEDLEGGSVPCVSGVLHFLGCAQHRGNDSRLNNVLPTHHCNNHQQKQKQTQRRKKNRRLGC